MPRDFIYKENDNIYLNIVFDVPIVNSLGTPITAATGEMPIPMEYTANKTLAIVDKCSDYYCSVVRFDIPLYEIPLFIMPVLPGSQQIGSPNPNLTPFIIGISYNGIPYPQNLIYTPENFITPPIQNQITQIITPYYYVYTYQILINMLNVALNLVWSASGLAMIFPTYNAPYFIYNATTELIALIVPAPFSMLTFPATTFPLIFINESLIRYLDSFNLFFVGLNQLNGVEYYFICNNLLPINPSNPTFNPTPPQVYPTEENAYAPFGTVPTNPPKYFIYTENYSSIQYWSSLRKILITSGSIPITYENIPSNNNSDVAVSLPILTDYVVPLNHGGDGRTVAYYYPTAQYRLVDMISDMPLYKVNIKVYWEDIYLNRYPLTISIGQAASIKLGFFRKTLYKGAKMMLK
jgi:hypothetical protein